MPLKGVKPAAIEKRLKALIYGKAGVGKTMCCIQFPQPYLIDTERGAEHAQYTDLLNKSGGMIFQTNDFNEVVQEVRTLLTEKHNFKTLIIDSMTTIFNDLVDKESVLEGTKFGRHYSAANKKMKTLGNLIMKLDMNVIVTAHSKNEYNESMSILGTTFDCFKGADHFFDIAFEVQKRGNDRVAIVKKSRIETLPDGEVIPFSYQEVAARYGKDVIEKEAVPQLLATAEEVKEMLALIDRLKLPTETYSKWLNKEDVESFEYMSQENIQKCIHACRNKLKVA